MGERAQSWEECVGGGGGGARGSGEGVMGVSCSIRFESYAVATNAGSQLNSVSRQKETVDIRMAVIDSWANMKEPAAGSNNACSSGLRAPGKGVAGGGFRVQLWSARRG